MCIFPRLIRNKKYQKTKKNGGNVPAVTDTRVLMVPVGCGRCMECCKQKAREWKVRLNEDIRLNRNGKPFTFTFSDESIRELSEGCEFKGYELDNYIATKAMRRFLERWRKKYKKSLRHWFVTELGQNGTENIHLHGIVWTDNVEDVKKIWHYGFVRLGNGLNHWVNEQTVNYMVKYVHKVDIKHKMYKPIVLTSPGIGRGYTERPDSKCNEYKGELTVEQYRTRQGMKLPLPIYYRNKIYSEEEREKLWLLKLDREVRYVNGVEIDISNGEEGYYDALERAQLLNIKLGYGGNKIDWKRATYERMRREELQGVRIERAEKKQKGDTA